MVTGPESGTAVTLQAASWADGGGVVLAYRGAAATPIQAVSALAVNDNGATGDVTSALVNGVSWSGSANVVSLVLMSWQPNSAALTWPSGYTLQATATDSYSSVAVGANVTSQTATSLGPRIVTLSTPQAVVPTLQLAVLVGS